MLTPETGVFDEANSRTDRVAGNGASALSEMIRRLTADLGVMVNLKLDLLKAEVKENISGYARDGVMLAVAAAMAVFGVALLNVALVFFLASLLPWSLPVNVASGALIISTLYAVGAVTIAVIYKKRLGTRTMIPTRTMEELKRDKQWLTETIK